MTRIYLVRHAEAEGNFYRRIQGQFDSYLAPLGLKQVQALGRRFENIHIDEVYSSDLNRAAVTAAALIKDGVPLYTTRLLREISLGVWEDTEWGNIQHREPLMLSYFINDPEKFSVPESETVFEVVARMKKALKTLAFGKDGKTIAVVSHSAALRFLLADLLDIPFSEINRLSYAENTSVTLLTEENGKVTAEYIGDASHLPPELKRSRAAVPVSPDGRDTKHLRFEDITAAESVPLWITRRLSDLENSVTAVSYRLDDIIGAVSVDLSSFSKEGAGLLKFLELEPKYRGFGYSPQLLGRAVRACRDRGFNLLLSQDENAGSEAFLIKMGFKGQENSGLFALDISLPPKAF